VSRPRAVLFDWDNTLVESWEIIHQTLRQTFLDLSREPWTFEQTKAWVRRSMRDSFPEIFGTDAGEAERLFYHHYRQRHIEQLAPLTGARETIAALHDHGIYLGVVSSKQGVLVRNEAAYLGWADFFGRIVGAEDGPDDKPAPGAVALALEGSGIEPGTDVWYIGDTGIDVLCARNADCVALVIGRDPPYDGANAHRPDHQFADHMRFQDFLQQHGITI
jgi:phosphoglycolate phosphatase